MPEKRPRTWTILICPECGEIRNADHDADCDEHYDLIACDRFTVIDLSILEGLVEELETERSTARIDHTNYGAGVWNAYTVALTKLKVQIEATKEVPSE